MASEKELQEKIEQLEEENRRLSAKAEDAQSTLTAILFAGCILLVF